MNALLPFGELVKQIHRVEFESADDARELINAVSCRVLDEVRDELAPVLEHLDKASDACPDVKLPTVETESCGHCAGSGEGRHDGAVCSSCRGSGTERHVLPFAFTPMQQDRIAQQRKALGWDQP